MASVGYVADSNDADLLALAGNGATAQAKVNNAILVGAAQIDACFQKAGYAVPVDSSVLTNAERQARLDALLEDINRGLAEEVLTRGTAGQKGTPAKAEQNAKRVKALLGKVCSGEIAFEELTSSGNEGFRAVGNVTWPDTDTLYDIEDVMGEVC